MSGAIEALLAAVEELRSASDLDAAIDRCLAAAQAVRGGATLAPAERAFDAEPEKLGERCERESQRIEEREERERAFRGEW